MAIDTSLSIENLSRNLSIGPSGGEAGVGRVGIGPASSPVADGKSFSDVLRESVDKVNQDQQSADQAIKELVAGRSKNIHETMLAIERADASLKMMMQVRNKILDAYKEIMRMQV